MASDVGIPEDIRDVVKGAIAGIHQFVETEVIPLEREHAAVLNDERRFFREDGRAVDEALDVRRRVRMKSAEAGYYTMFAPESLPRWPSREFERRRFDPTQDNSGSIPAPRWPDSALSCLALATSRFGP